MINAFNHSHFAIAKRSCTVVWPEVRLPQSVCRAGLRQQSTTECTPLPSQCAVQGLLSIAHNVQSFV